MKRTQRKYQYESWMDRKQSAKGRGKEVESAINPAATSSVDSAIWSPGQLTEVGLQVSMKDRQWRQSLARR